MPLWWQYAEQPQAQVGTCFGASSVHPPSLPRLTMGVQAVRYSLAYNGLSLDVSGDLQLTGTSIMQSLCRTRGQESRSWTTCKFVLLFWGMTFSVADPSTGRRRSIAASSFRLARTALLESSSWCSGSASETDDVFNKVNVGATH